MKIPVTLTRDETDGRIVVTFRDIPEAVTQGATVKDALMIAAPVASKFIAIRAHVERPPRHRKLSKMLKMHD